MFRLFRKSREALKKYLLAGFLFVMALSMVGVVTPFFTGGDSDQAEMNALAEVYGERITPLQLQRIIQSQLRNSALGSDSRMVGLVANSILEGVVLRRTLDAQAEKLGLAVTDQELLQAERAIPWLSSPGSSSNLEDIVQRQTGMTVAEFEAALRGELLQRKIQAVVTDGLQASPAEVRDEFLRRNTRAKIEYVVFEPSDFLEAVKVTPQLLEAFFNKDPKRYQIPERRRVRYALIDSDSVRGQVRSNDDELRRHYMQHLADYRVPERVKIVHILFKTAEKTAAELATIEKTAQDVLGQLKAGKDFGELAQKYSEDSSASNGGEIGWIVRGQTVKEFEDVAFALKPGQLSGLVKTVYGIHILKVLEKQTAHLQAFDDVKESLRVTLEKQRVEAAQQALAAKLERELQSGPERFETVMRAAGLTVRQTPLFRYNEKLPDFGDSTAFADLSFQLPVGKVGQPITIPKGVAIMQVTEIVPEHVPKLEEVRARVEQDFRADQSRALASERAREFAAKAKAGNFREVARALGLKVKVSKDFTQQESVEDLIPGSAVGAAFTLALGQISDVVSLGTNHIVFRTLSRTPPQEADFAPQQDQIREEVLERKRALAFEVYRRNLKDSLIRSGELKFNDAAMKQFLAAYQRP